MSRGIEREQELFEAALALAPTERMAFLTRACGGDAALLRRVEGLLRCHQGTDPLLDAVIRRASLEPSEHLPAPGGLIGSYKLLEKIGEGGCGLVYLAEQEHPVRRQVALKIIKLGMDTREIIARFKLEQQALAIMDHPGIARVYEAGATSDGRPYFVMELVRGARITDYCDDKRLPAIDRVKLFAQICHAIQHAHQKGIIHRDLKPSNILVTEVDGVPMPKIIDFGIAKATQGLSADQTAFTAIEQFVGTPAYMSPEQSELGVVDVDTRSDIYSLGVLLYELLTGRTPFETAELLKAGMEAMRRQIREVEPPRPSQRLSTLRADVLTQTAERRATAAPRLIQSVRGDLDWIVMRCLEKNRGRRYETANELARDIERHLANEPITARPPGVFYRIGKLVRRHRVACLAGAAIFVALVCGLGASTWMFLREKAARERAVIAEAQQVRLREQAEQARAAAIAAEAAQSQLRLQAEEAHAAEARLRIQAEANERKAESEATRSAQVAAFMQRMLRSVGPRVALGRDTKLLRDILDETSLRLDKELAGQRVVEAELRDTLGAVYMDLGEWRPAESMFRKAVAVRRQLPDRDTNPALATTLTRLGEVLSMLDALDESEACFREAVERFGRVAGSNSFAAASGLALLHEKRGDLAKAEACYRELLEDTRRSRGYRDPQVASALDVLAKNLFRQGRGDEAIAKLHEALDILAATEPNGTARPRLLGNLANVLLAHRAFAEAEKVLREKRELHTNLFGTDTLENASTSLQLGLLLFQSMRLEEAEEEYRRGEAIARKTGGAQHPTLALALSGIARVRIRLGDFPAAERLVTESLAIETAAFGSEHARTQRTADELAAIRENLRSRQSAMLAPPAANTGEDKVEIVSVSPARVVPRLPQTISVKVRYTLKSHPKGRLMLGVTLHAPRGYRGIAFEKIEAGQGEIELSGTAAPTPFADGSPSSLMVNLAPDPTPGQWTPLAFEVRPLTFETPPPTDTPKP